MKTVIDKNDNNDAPIIEFDITFEAAILRLALEDDYFCAQLVRYLASDEDFGKIRVFSTEQFQYIFRIIAESFAKYKTRPMVAQIRTAILQFASEAREPYFKALEIVCDADIHNKAFFQEHITTYVQVVKVYQANKKIRSISKDKPLEVPDLMQKILDDIRKVQFEQEDVVHLTNLYTLLDKTDSKGNKIRTGLDQLDNDLRGGFPRETLVTVLGSSNAGKTIFCTSLGCSALRDGYKVFHINLEGTRDEALYRYVANLSDVEFRTIEEKNWTAPEKVRLDEAVNRYKDNLRIQNMLNFGATIEQLISCCRETYKEFPFDMLIVDYGQLLKTRTKFDKGTDRQTEAYRGLDSLSKEFKCVVISPAQATREGIKKQNDYVANRKNQEENRLPVLRSADLADCIEIARVSAVIITLNRTDEEEKRGWLRVFLEKSRRGEKAKTYGVKAKYGKMNLLVNDYYNPNSLIQKADEEKDDGPSVEDINARKLSEIDTGAAAIRRKEMKHKPTLIMKDPIEARFNELMEEAIESAIMSDDYKKKAQSAATDQESEQCYENAKTLMSAIKDLKKEAAELLPKFMPTASEELYKAVKSSLTDKNNNSSGTDEQNEKSDLIFKQLAFIYEKK
jgi:replicative DNA helicase